MTVRLRREQCCDEPNCIRPARYGTLCARCFMAASPARRSVELQPSPLDGWDIVTAAERLLR